MTMVLLMDDDPGMRATLRMMLQPLKYLVIEAADGEAGVSLFRSHKPDLVITDILMPKKDGIEAICEMRKLDPEARIIAMSGGGADKYPDPLSIARDSGAKDVIKKPFRRELLVETISRVLGNFS